MSVWFKIITYLQQFFFIQRWMLKLNVSYENRFWSQSIFYFKIIYWTMWMILAKVIISTVLLVIWKKVYWRWFIKRKTIKNFMYFFHGAKHLRVIKRMIYVGEKPDVSCFIWRLRQSNILRNQGTSSWFTDQARSNHETQMTCQSVVIVSKSKMLNHKMSN
jgi:hypothetical protein